ncbi:biotin--[acetyl-CoA-carboxylase] ligase [Pseudorhodoplanes sinuspersici]|uniref:biotin--[biotin carboxyl-carrier protein] ligase n=1 Tax=Pseudorhodoplanes sinuspersici TaxID=1235591 RepID=A0A1W6ZWG9_9HYPH|nr:biotin--[acetyl-CoA-carboxylase] ligase [Pseudorhodoplanes sinuspersici]ARQ01628.1 biotin--[acetyl-CoA-carboxylase] ligase [Pseudorhodoplanes sinuspersici]RKE73345.1 BirA family biotin operon repressor/biotin-[acetyl-CoA-carboxylase] ligase [Pseudorhodoplanes sinuspersici]
MVFAVGPRAKEAGYRVRSFDRLDSTNSEAMRLAQNGERGPLWVVTEEQTAGRGRQGREWQSFIGNLAASLLITNDLKLSDAATLGFVAGLAAHEACAVAAPGLSLSLKWPNDLLANGAFSSDVDSGSREENAPRRKKTGKLAGLLLESQNLGDRLALVVGIGVNVAAAPEGMGYPAVSLAGLGYPVQASNLFASLTEAFVKYDSLWNRGRGFADIRRLWLERAHGVGKSVSVHMGDRIEHGIFETLDEHGCLILRKPDGTACTIAAGDVYFGDARTVQAGVSK